MHKKLSRLVILALMAASISSCLSTRIGSYEIKVYGKNQKTNLEITDKGIDQKHFSRSLKKAGITKKIIMQNELPGGYEIVYKQSDGSWDSEYILDHDLFIPFEQKVKVSPKGAYLGGSIKF